MKSLFLMPTRSKKMLERQHEEFERFAKANRKLDGAFAEEKGGIEKIAVMVRGNEPLGIVQGMLNDKRNKSCLDILYSIGDAEDGSLVIPSLRTAGFVANIQPKNCTKKRIVELDDLVTLDVAVFRKLGYDAMFSFVDFGGAGGKQTCVTPAISMMENSEIKYLTPGFSRHLPGTSSKATIEVLGDAAAFAYLHFRNVGFMIKSLVADSTDQDEMFGGEFELRAIAIGHELYRAQRLWTVEEAFDDVDFSRALHKRKRMLIRPIRHALEDDIVNTLVTHFEDFLEKIRGMLPERWWTGMNAIMNVPQAFAEFTKEFGDLLKGNRHPEAKELHRTLIISGTIHHHNHDESECWLKGTC